MWAQEIFVYLYPLLSISCILGYLPQIHAFYATESAPSGFSFLTWFIWVGETGITLGYGVFHLKDTVFCLMTGLDLVMILAVIGLAYRARLRFAKPKPSLRAAFL